MINTVVWDMDGTILDTLDDLKDSVNYALAAYGFAPYGRNEIKAMLGNGIRELVKAAVPDGENNPQFESCFSVFKSYYQQHMNDKTRPYAGIPEVMKILREKKWKQAIVSNKIDSGVQELARTYYPFVDAAIGERKGLARKPQPDMVRAALSALGAEKETAVYIGDSEVDLETARNSGMPCISVAWGFRDIAALKRFGAELIVEKPEQLIAALDELQSAKG